MFSKLCSNMCSCGDVDAKSIILFFFPLHFDSCATQMNPPFTCCVYFPFVYPFICMCSRPRICAGSTYAAHSRCYSLLRQNRGPWNESNRTIARAIHPTYSLIHFYMPPRMYHHQCRARLTRTKIIVIVICVPTLCVRSRLMHENSTNTCSQRINCAAYFSVK